MTKKTSLIIVFLTLSAILVCLVIAKLLPANNHPTPNITRTENADNTSNLPNKKSLGGHECLSKFTVERGANYETILETFKLELFQSFGTGAFFGKIENFQPGQNKQFSALIDQLMKEDKIATYAHLKADVCLYHEDSLNPENGASLNYYIEHYYCTNQCQTGKYEIEVDLDANGNFVGYRTSQNIY